MKENHDSDTLLVFPSRLGWMAVRCGRSAARELSFGNPSAAAAANAIGGDLKPAQKLEPWQSELVKLMQDYAEGDPVDLSGIPVDLGKVTSFRAKVLNTCRKIPYGGTASYGQLAAKVGAAGAARAVGTCMARNPLPLIIPCHRVTRTGGTIGRYSGVEGTKTKSQLLDMEASRAALNRV